MGCLKLNWWNKIKNIVKNDMLPNSSANENRCGQCEYLNFCDDRF